ncbi:MAG: hypothetical protein WAL99_01455 [Pseudonocardiaceae bacterium]
MTPALADQGGGEGRFRQNVTPVTRGPVDQRKRHRVALWPGLWINDGLESGVSCALMCQGGIYIVRRTEFRRKDKESGVDILAAVVAVIKEALEVVRAAIVSWPVTARLCFIIVVVAATTCTTGLVLR